VAPALPARLQSLKEFVLAQCRVPLSEAALCLDDETVFSIRDRACPLCGSETITLLAPWLSDRARREKEMRP
jgi:hypothetical protein